MKGCLVAMVAILSGCTNLPIAPADDGLDYSFTNGCVSTILVELGSGGREIELATNEQYTLRTLDEVADSEFVVRAVDDSGEVRFAPGVTEFVISGDRCP